MSDVAAVDEQAVAASVINAVTEITRRSNSHRPGPPKNLSITAPTTGGSLAPLAWHIVKCPTALLRCTAELTTPPRTPRPTRAGHCLPRVSPHTPPPARLEQARC